MKHLTFAFLAASLAFFTTTAPVWAEPLKIVGFGDSLMAGYGLNPSESFPEKLEKALRNNGHDVVITNAGVCGDTSSGGLSRLNWSVPDETQLDHTGTRRQRHAARHRPSTRRAEPRQDACPAQGAQNSSAAGRHGRRTQSRSRLWRTVRHDLSEAGQKYGVTLHPFFLDGVAGDPKLLLEDGIHPTAEGIDRMVAKALPTFEKGIAGK